MNNVDHKDDTVINEAFKVRLNHNDPFDCFIFATAKALAMTLVTEDESASSFLHKESVLNWTGLKRKLRV